MFPIPLDIGYFVVPYGSHSLLYSMPGVALAGDIHMLNTCHTITKALKSGLRFSEAVIKFTKDQLQGLRRFLRYDLLVKGETVLRLIRFSSDELKWLAREECFHKHSRFAPASFLPAYVVFGPCTCLSATTFTRPGVCM